MQVKVNKIKGKTLFDRLNLKWVNLIPYIVLILLIIIIGIIQPNTINLSWLGIKTDATLPLIFATAGQTVVLLTGGIDLSLGGILSLTNSLAAIKMTDNLGSMIGLSIGLLIMGAVLGSINGFIIVKLRIQPFIATLITWSIYGGIALWVLPVEGGNVPKPFINTLLARPANIPLSLIIILALAGLWLYIKNTPFGIYLLALGSSENSGYLNGINNNRIKIAVYALSGLFAACAGLFRTAQVTAGSPLAGNSFILISVAAAVIGGTSLAGGKGSIVGGIIGAFILKLIADLLIFSHISSNWSSLFQGLLLIIIIVFVSAMDLMKRKEEIRL
ncbi:MAG: ABC transporter permease [Actinobacteria bacterium]|nr:ABC transporter permease [Actinomycetota bacterium]